MDKSHCVKCRNFTYFLVWKFCGKAQSPHSFGRNRAPQNFHTCWKLQHFTQWSAAWLRKSLIRASHEMGSTANAFQKIFKIAFITLSSLSLSLFLSIFFSFSFSFYLFLFLFFCLSLAFSFSLSRSLFLSCSIFFFLSPPSLFSLSLSFSLSMIASALGQSCWANTGNYCNYTLEFFMRSNTEQLFTFLCYHYVIMKANILEYVFHCDRSTKNRVVNRVNQFTLDDDVL